MQIENHTLYFREHAQSKCGTFEYLEHRPGGGDKKVCYYFTTNYKTLHLPLIPLRLYFGIPVSYITVFMFLFVEYVYFFNFMSVLLCILVLNIRAEIY